jgi:hypothetical protein
MIFASWILVMTWIGPDGRPDREVLRFSSQQACLWKARDGRKRWPGITFTCQPGGAIMR